MSGSRVGVVRIRTWGGVVFSLRRFFVRGREEKGIPSGSSVSRCRLRARRARGVSSFSGSEEEESGSMSGSLLSLAYLIERRWWCEWAWASLFERRSGQASDTAAAAIIECVGRMEEG